MLVVVTTDAGHTLTLGRLKKRKLQEDKQSRQPQKERQSFKSSKSFRILSEGEVLSINDGSRGCDLLMLPITITRGSGPDGESRSSALTTTNIPAKLSLASVDLHGLGTHALDDTEVHSTAEFLVGVHAQNELAGLALRCTKVEQPGQVHKLVKRLRDEHISVLILCNHDSDTLGSIDLQHASGIILENACILPNGERRDYFRSKQLRTAMARCMKIREDTPDFFIGFLELWEQRPHPSVIRRAVKLAEHFGAIIEHGPSNPALEIANPVKEATSTLSGFEYLRRSESTEVRT